MKKTRRRIVISLAVLFALLLIAFILIRWQYPIHKADLGSHIAAAITEMNSSAVSDILICDSNYSNCHAAFIITATFEDGESKYYGACFDRLPLLTYYRETTTDSREAWLFQFSDTELGQTLLTKGLPYDIAYDISSYQLVEITRGFSNRLRIWISSLIIGILAGIATPLLRKYRTRILEKYK